jgi:hypothetical protein
MEFADVELIADGGRSVHATSAAPIEAIVTTAKSFRIPESPGALPLLRAKTKPQGVTERSRRRSARPNPRPAIDVTDRSFRRNNLISEGLGLNLDGPA